MASLHPFDPIRPDEIQLACQILRASFKQTTLRFKTIEIKEPPKQDVIPYIEAERLGKPLPAKPARTIYALFHRLDSGAFIKALVNLDAKSVSSAKQLPAYVQGPVDVDEMMDIEKICLEHPDVIKEIEKMKLPKGVTVCNDPWIYGTDDPKESRRLFQCYMYIVSVEEPQTNHYSLPCTFSPVFDAITKELVRMDYLPTGAGHEIQATQPWKPIKAIEYAHDLLDEPLRSDLKPYIVQQPQGASFNVDGQLVEWQKWRFRVGFNYREGLVLYNVTYHKRNVFYRLSLSEMTVPYGDPRRPYHRKQAFDVGDVGLGITCNQLSLGCDCLGHIKYFDGWRTDSKGIAVQLKNVICLHEQDSGILHKHTNYRNAQATVVRNRQLAVQMICTVSNYEYIFAWYFDLAGGIEFEVRATGILSTAPINNQDGLSVPWSTNIGPGVSAPYHQHIFSLRIDPAIDGFNNTVVYEDSVPLPPELGVEDPYGVGYIAKTTVFDKAGYAENNVDTARSFKIRNDSVINKISGRPVAYKVKTLATQKMIMSPRGFNRRRAKFTDHDVWVTKYQDDELYAAGEFTNQSRGSEGVETWAERGDNVANSDVVVWHTFGLTHNPRPEDFPVMPVERISIHLTPSGFHEKNPALDVPPSTQAFNQSKLHADKPNLPADADETCCARDSKL
ncbi:primary-amine oxidase [Fusarium albosuccineum]|uniref:Amine oxidase n=1 Tax=Fusarium albosuccineum TaxID=1237068 RepID=A0A8H4PAT2_9HYPO|nr:primary-amine oxidase [Fusarium albosuccineum]